MNVYHTFEKKNGFDLKRIDFNRGIFTIKAWWVDHPQYGNKYSKWHPNEFGDTVVELDIDEHAKTYKSSEQLSVLEDLFGKDNPKVQKIVQKFELGEFDRPDWQMIDTLIGKTLREKGYKIIHYTDDAMFGETWAIIDPSVIKSIRFENG